MARKLGNTALARLTGRFVSFMGRTVFYLLRLAFSAALSSLAIWFLLGQAFKNQHIDFMTVFYLQSCLVVMIQFVMSVFYLEKENNES